jgi:outer membrane protein assembly factor BamA
MTTRRITCACLLASACAWSSTVGAQDAPPESGAAGPGRLARAISWAESELDGGAAAADGFYPEFGGMITGAGVSLGPGYRQHIFGDRAFIDASIARSWHGYSMMQSTITAPRLLDDRLTIGAQVKYQDFTQINFFGVGNGTLKTDQTDYRLKYFDVGGFAAVHPNRSVTITGRAGLMRRAGVLQGTSTLYPSVEERFDESSAPGLTQQPNYAHADIAIESDTRDVPGYPSRGGRHRASIAAFDDREIGRYSFRRVEVETSQYVPVTDRSVFSIRGRMDLSQTAAGQQVPFYMLPALGSGQTLRGYADYRFRDRDLLLLSAEYRLPIARALDAAVFYDAGTVAPTAAGVLSMRTMHTDYGIGVRAHSNRHVLVRLDLARSREGMQAVVSFTPSMTLSKRTVAPYVP